MSEDGLVQVRMLASRRGDGRHLMIRQVINLPRAFAEQLIHERVAELVVRQTPKTVARGERPRDLLERMLDGNDAPVSTDHQGAFDKGEAPIADDSTKAKRTPIADKKPKVKDKEKPGAIERQPRCGNPPKDGGGGRNSTV